VLRTTLQSDSVRSLQPLLPQGQRWQQSWARLQSSSNIKQQEQQGPQQQQRQQQQQQQQQGRLVRLVQGNTLTMQLRQQLEGLELTADLAMNEMCADSVTRYTTTPLRITLDVAPSGNFAKRMRLHHASASSAGAEGAAGGSGNSRAGGSGSAGSGSSSGSAAPGGSGSDGGRGSRSSLQGLLFRVGLHGVVAPLEDSGSSGASASGQQQQQQQQHCLSMHAQGALAITGTKTLWEAGRKPWQAAADAAAAAQRKRKQQQQQQQQQQQTAPAELAVQPLHADGRRRTTGGSAAAAAAAAAAADGAPADSSSRGGSKQQRQGSGSGDTPGRHSRGSSSKPRVLSLNGREIQLPLCNPGAVQDSLQVCV
jgi:hypothetical protein